MVNALSDTAVTTAGTPATINVLANDTGTGLVITSFSNPANGSLVFNGDKSFTYTPAAGFLGNDTFSYTVRDAQGTPATAEVTISVIANTGATVAADDFVEVIAGGGLVVPVLANDMAAGGGELQIIAVSVPGHGVVNVLADQSIRYVPQTGFVGIDSFTYTVLDDQGSTASATVTVKVVAANSAPIAMDDSFAVVADTTTVLAVLANDNDPNGGPLQIVGFTMPAHGNLDFDTTAKTFSYTPAAGYEGPDQFTYTIRDNRGASASASVTLTVARTVASPGAVDDQVTTEADVPVTIDVLANDSLPEGQNIGIIAVTLPLQGKLDFNPDKTVTYTPKPGFVGTDDFTYTLGNGKGDTARATVTIVVTPATASADTFANGYGYRRRIAVPAGSVKGASQQNFPLWIELAGTWLRSTANGGKVTSPAGDDLRFELADGTKLAHEIERYDAATGKLGAWVRVPELRHDAATVLSLYYGKPGLETSEAAPQDVWQDYLAVWHLPDGVNAASPSRSLTASGTITSSTSGLGAGATALNGNGFLTIADTDWLQGHAALSVQFRSKADNLGHDRGQLGAGSTLFSSGDGDLIVRYQSVGYGDSQPQNLLHTTIATTAGKVRVSSGANTQSRDWQSITLAWQSGDQLSDLYLDGAPAEPSFTMLISETATTQISGPLYVGASSRDSETGGWAGLIDEVRFRAGKLTDAWIAAEHANQSTPALFYGLGDEETIAEPDASIVALPLDVKTPTGEWIEIDVLAAARIPDGVTNPTIQAVAQPDNGTVSVIDDKIRYSPAASFIGEDDFTFTLAADGRSSTALLRVTVEASEQPEQGGDSGDTSNYLRTVDVANATQLTAALTNAQAGDDIVLANGTYSSNFSLAANGTADHPIRIRAADPGSAVIAGRLFLAGRYNIVQHCRWQGFSGGDSIIEVTGRDCRVHRCWFIDCGVSNGAQRGAIRLQPGAHDCQVTYNEFRRFAQRAISVRSVNGGALRAVIRRNYLKQNTVVSGFSGVAIGFGGDSEKGADMRRELFGLVEYNLIEDVGGGMGNILQAKSSRNTFQFNTARDCDSFMEIRSGQFCDVVANAILNGGGPSLQGVGHRMIGNFNDGGASGSWRDMGPRGGLLSLKSLGDNESTSQQTWAEDCLLAGNIGILRMGGGSSSWQPTRNNIIEAHNGSVVNQNVTGTTTRSLTVSVPPYQILTAVDVGPLANGGAID